MEKKAIVTEANGFLGQTKCLIEKIYISITKLLQKEHGLFTSGYQTYDFICITDAIGSIIEVFEKGKEFNHYYIIFTINTSDWRCVT